MRDVRFRSFTAALGLLCLFTGPGPTFSQPKDRPADNPTVALIADAAEKATAKKWLDAIEQFQRVLDTAGDELVPVDGRQHMPARWIIHGHLARLPAEAIELYRQRVDGQAAKRLTEATAERGDAGLLRILADMFNSRASEAALLELARRAFERGEFDRAERFWRMLIPVTDPDDLTLHFPGPKTDPASIRARLILVKLFRNERDEAAADLNVFREKHADAAGLLAGKTGKYADTLAELMAKPALTTAGRGPDDSQWTTFAGGPGRGGNVRSKLPYFWPDTPSWRTSLPLKPYERFDENRGSPTHPRSLAFHPLILDGRVVLADGEHVFSADLMTGQFATVAQPQWGVATKVPSKQDIRHTLTEANGIVYVRMGPAALKAAEPGDQPGFIAALGPNPPGKVEREVRWRQSPPVEPDATTHFEGTPVVHRGRMYAAFWRQSGGEAFAGIACYRHIDLKEPPELVWKRIVGKAGGEPAGAPRYRHELVSVAGPNVVSCTNGGAVVALDLATGQPAWEYRYPRNERAALPRYRDLCPPLVDGGRIYAAPADADRLLCLDAVDGRLIWEREGIEVVHLLGVARGRLIATTGGAVKGIRGLNIHTGADSGPNGWTIHDDDGAVTCGRGLVSDDAVIWPTTTGLYFLHPADGAPLRSPILGLFGNLCYADGYLIVTTATEVLGYIAESKKVGDRRKAAQENPDDPVKNEPLARALIDAGANAAAEQAIAKTGANSEGLNWLMAERLYGMARSR